MTGDRVFDARAGRWADGTTVLIEGQAIVGVTGSVPDGWPVIEMPGTSLLPGLIDAHVHLAFDASADVVASLAACDDDALLDHMAAASVRALHAGVTTVRDLG